VPGGTPISSALVNLRIGLSLALYPVLVFRRISGMQAKFVPDWTTLALMIVPF
jgi:hypothetical protein